MAAERSEDEFVVALVGNPNVGKSTVFNALTGRREHTGNWAGKTVACAWGDFRWLGRRFVLVDLPGTYSLCATRAEERITSDFICWGKADAVLVVADGSCLERNLFLLLQVLEVSRRVVLCLNLQDEAQANGVRVDLLHLEKILGLSVVGTAAKYDKGLYELKNVLYRTCTAEAVRTMHRSRYSPEIEEAIDEMEAYVIRTLGASDHTRWFAMRLLAGDNECLARMREGASGVCERGGGCCRG